MGTLVADRSHSVALGFRSLSVPTSSVGSPASSYNNSMNGTIYEIVERDDLDTCGLARTPAHVRRAAVEVPALCGLKSYAILDQVSRFGRNDVK